MFLEVANITVQRFIVHWQTLFHRDNMGKGYASLGKVKQIGFRFGIILNPKVKCSI